MKKLFKTFLAFLILALVVEFAILISTKMIGWNNFESGRPFLAAVHVHLMVLGVIFFLLQMILEKLFNITQAKFYNVFYIMFLCGLTLSVSMMLYKGFAQIFGFSVIKALVEAIPAIAHTAIFVSLFFFSHCLYSVAVKEKTK